METADELRQLDAWIEQYIFGSIPRPHDDMWPWMGVDGFVKDCEKYSTQLLAAWKVLQECQRHHVLLSVAAATPQGYFGHAQIMATADDMGFSASTAPELICYMAKWAYEKMGAELWNESINPVYQPM